MGDTLTAGLQTASGQNVSASDVQEGSLLVNLSTILTFEHMYAWGACEPPLRDKDHIFSQIQLMIYYQCYFLIG